MTRAVRIRFQCGLILLLTLLTGCRGPDPRLQIQIDREQIPAGGAIAKLTITSSIPLASFGLESAIAEGVHSARIDRTWFEKQAPDTGTWHVTVRSKALPGTVKIAISLPPFAPVTQAVTITPSSRDVLHLDDPADATAFRSWFTFLAEVQFFRDTAALPPEISDCAALIRYAYREALRTHDADWVKHAALPLVPAIGPVRAYEYPYTPWGPALFRTGPDSAGKPSIGEFADAETLFRYNTRFVARDIRQAKPGDLLFFRQEDRTMPYHSMIFLGRSQVEDSPGPYIIYHTGPMDGKAGEIRRPTVAELQRHPDPAWHLTLENPHYLGVYRWNILW